MWTLKRVNLLIVSTGLTMIGVITSAGVLRRQQDAVPKAAEERKGKSTVAAPELVDEGAAAADYKIARLIRSSNEGNKVYLDISIEPEYFVRDKMVSLARRLNEDFPSEPLIDTVIFDNETAARNYNPVGGSYSISKKLERGEYYLDRLRGQEYIKFSLKRGNPVDEIKIVLSGGTTRVKRKKRSSHLGARSKAD